jgi:hypothetical protein
VTIRRQKPLEDLHSFSAWVHRECRVGDQLLVRGPRGNFTLDRVGSETPIIFLAAGIGITPIAAMLHDELQYPRRRRKWLFYQFRDLAKAPLLSELVCQIEKSETCRAVLAASQMTDVPKLPTKSAELITGRIDAATILKHVGSTKPTVLMCGPASWMRSMRADLCKLGFTREQILDEEFGEASPNPDAAKPITNDDLSTSHWQVHFEGSKKTVSTRSSEQTLLELAKQNGIEIPASCRSGHCGTCVVSLLKGQVAYKKAPQAELAENEILPCICTATSDVSLYA